MAKLNWIADNHLLTEVDKLLLIAQKAQNKALTDFSKNVIDPFSALFEMSGFETDFDTWQKSETTRQAQKTLQNHIGDFHQNILGCSPGWNNMKVGNVIDLVSPEKEIIAEIKNKYNTISGGKLSDLYNSLNGLVSPKSSIYKGYTAYYVAIIPKKPQRYNHLFTPSDKDKGEKCPPNDLIREIDGASFYSLVTGSDTALEDLFNVLTELVFEKSSPKTATMEKLKNFFRIAYQ